MQNRGRAKVPNQEARVGKVAVLVDGDNVSPKSLGEIIRISEGFGRIASREVFSNIAHVHAGSAWQKEAVRHAFYVRALPTGKNGSDIALAIAAMDALHQGDVDVIVVASSDADFMSLAVRVRHAGLTFVGVGSGDTSDLYRSACDSFHVLSSASGEADSPSAGESFRSVLYDIYRANAGEMHEDGHAWVNFTYVGNHLKEIGRSIKDYGGKRLLDLVQKTEGVSIRQEGKVFYFRICDED